MNILVFGELYNRIAHLILTGKRLGDMVSYPYALSLLG